MTKRISFLKINLKRHKKKILFACALALIAVYPLQLASEYVSALILIEDNYLVGEEVKVDYPLDIKIYENFFNEEGNKKFSEILIDNIDQAQKEIQIAIYSFNIDEIRDALIRAADRGVEVTIYYNNELKMPFNYFMRDAIEKINVVYIKRGRHDYDLIGDFYSMHHKLMIIDAGLENQVLFTGAWNWSYHQEDLDPNTLFEIEDPEIISSYYNEIKRLENNLFSKLKFQDFDYSPWDKTIIYPNNESIEIWFSPGRKENSIQTRIKDLISNAKETIDIEMTQINSTILLLDLINKAKEGVKIRMIVDTNVKNGHDSTIPMLEEAIKEHNISNISIIEGGTKPTYEKPLYSIFHRHNMIIDNEIVLSGTANWSTGGFFQNDENILIFHSPRIAALFKENFEKYLEYLANRES
jgi:phosphatidylserine/phosphatidylglycerophosphate/cardiolipin synthase-like enzyme